MNLRFPFFKIIFVILVLINSLNVTFATNEMSSANYHSLPNNKALLENVQSQWGEILEPNKFPILHKAVALIFNDLARAQEKYLESKTAAVNYIHIVQSSEINAFVWTDFDTGIKIQRNHLFITTGIIRELLLGSKTESTYFKQKLAKDGIDIVTKKEIVSKMSGLLSGIIAHELGHPIDKTSLSGGDGDVSGISLENHYGRESASQAIEIKADIMGMKILRLANYPTDSLYNALNILFGDGIPNNILGSIASTHPHLDFRLSSARLYLTSDRLNNGINSNQNEIYFSDNEILTLFSELDKVEEKKGRFPYSKPKNLSDIAERLTTISKVNGSENFEYYELEFNRLLLSFDHILYKKQLEGIELTADEKLKLKDIIIKVYKILTKNLYYKDFSIYKIDEIRNYINKQSGVSGLESSPTHFYFLEKIKVFRSIEIHDVVKKLQSEFESNNPVRNFVLTDSLSKHLIAIASISDPEIFFEFNKLIIKKYLQEIWISRSNNNYLKGEELNIFHSFGIRFQSKFVQLGIELRESIQKVPFVWKIFTSTLYSNWAPIPIIKDKSEVNENLLLTLYRQGKMLEKHGKSTDISEALKLFKENCTQIWELRGFYGASEILFKNNMIDWSLIIEVLEFDKKIAFNQIEKDVIKYMNGKINYENKEIPPFNMLLLVGTKDKFYLFEKKGIPSWLVWNSKNLNPIINGTINNLKLENSQIPLNSKTIESSIKTLSGIYQLKEKPIFKIEYHNKMSKTLREITNFDSKQLDQDFLTKVVTTHVNFFSNIKNINLYTNIDSSSEINLWNDSFLLEKQINFIMNSDFPVYYKKLWFESLFIKAIENEEFFDQKSKIIWDKYLSSLSLIGTDINRTLKYLNMKPLNSKIISTHNELFQSNVLDLMLKLKNPPINFDEQWLTSRDSSYFEALASIENIFQEFLNKYKPGSIEELFKWVSLIVPLTDRKSLYELEYEESKKTV